MPQALLLTILCNSYSGARSGEGACLGLVHMLLHSAKCALSLDWKTSHCMQVLMSPPCLSHTALDS
eukprot:3777911-Amphidinium_carterae.1